MFAHVGNTFVSLIFKMRFKTLLSHRFSSLEWLGISISWIIQKGKGGRRRVLGKGEGPRENWEKVQVLQICRGAGVVTSRVIRDEYRI